jgi:histidinol-phosphatase
LAAELPVNAEWRQRYEVAVEACHRAGRVALAYFDTGLAVEWKSDQSPVTVADREAELALRDAIRQSFPADGFLGEEFGDTPGSTGFRWIIDPIDGTRNFVRGIPIWATLVGLEYRGEVIAGVCDVPPLGHTYRALRGEGAWRNDHRLHVSPIADLSQSVAFYSSLSWFMKAGRERQFIELSRRAERLRGFGDFYGHVLVAQGSGEIMVEHGVHPWDVAAILPIVEEAGGRFSDWSGARTIHSPDVLITNGKLHDEVLRILSGPKEG